MAIPADGGPREPNWRPVAVRLRWKSRPNSRRHRTWIALSQDGPDCAAATEGAPTCTSQSPSLPCPHARVIPSPMTQAHLPSIQEPNARNPKTPGPARRAVTKPVSHGRKKTARSVHQTADSRSKKAATSTTTNSIATRAARHIGKIEQERSRGLRRIATQKD